MRDSERPTTLAEMRAVMRSVKGLKPIPPWFFGIINVLAEDAGYSDDDEIPFVDHKVRAYHLLPLTAYSPSRLTAMVLASRSALHLSAVSRSGRSPK